MLQDKQDSIFKQITEAYSILSDKDLRQKYDRLIFGESATNTSSNFENQEDYKFWEQSRPKDDKAARDARIKDKLRNFKDYKDFLKTYENHKTMHDARSTLFREEGFRDLHEKYGTDYNVHDDAENPNSQMNEKWHVYKEQYFERYWDTKTNAEYYSQPTSTRAWITLKKVISFYKDFATLWLLSAGFFVIYNAHVRSKKARAK